MGNSFDARKMDIFLNIYVAAIIILSAMLLYFVLQRIGKKRQLQHSKKMGFKIFALAVYIFLVVKVTGFGTLYDLLSYPELIRPDQINLVPFATFGMKTSMLNLIMVVPFGILLPLIWEDIRFKSVLGYSFLFSLMIEVSQLFNVRTTDIDDLIMNTIGGIVGFGIYFVLAKLIKGKEQSGAIGNFLAPEARIVKYEPLLYLLIPLLSFFLLYNWRFVLRPYL